MKPTMKLRLKKVDSLYKGDPAVRNSYDELFVLQQWWEYPPPRPLGMPGPIGEWRDIPIEVEE